MNGQDAFTTFKTGLGFVAIGWNDRGITSLRLPAGTASAAEGALLKRLPNARRSEPPAHVARVIADIVRYFEGERIDFSGVRVDLGAQEPFFEDVYAEVRKLGWGETTTYGSVAKALAAEPQAARDVGQAMATNPVPLIVPCHRVLAAGKRIGGFSAPGGSATKTRMLVLEGAGPVPDPRSTRQEDKSRQGRLGF